MFLRKSQKPPKEPEQPDNPAEPEADQAASSRKRDKFKMFWNEGLDYGKDGLLKGKLMLEHQLGLGPKPNVIPPDEAEIECDHRSVEIGWHPVAGFAGKWFAEQTGLGKMITEKINRYPDPTQHWAVLVGEYAHQLWMDENLDVIYINEQVKREEWHTFPVGQTRFNDEALRQAGEMVIFNMRAQRPAYNLISNNCQNFATKLLDAIQVGAHKQFATSFAVYKAATGKGRIKDLFADDSNNALPANVPGPGGDVNQDEAPPEPEHQQAMQLAHQVMEENTTHLDSHHGHVHEHGQQHC